MLLIRRWRRSGTAGRRGRGLGGELRAKRREALLKLFLLLLGLEFVLRILDLLLQRVVGVGGRGIVLEERLVAEEHEDHEGHENEDGFRLHGTFSLGTAF